METYMNYITNPSCKNLLKYLHPCHSYGLHFLKINISYYCQYIFIAHYVYTNTQLKLSCDVRILIHSSFCELNFKLPACRPNFAEVARISKTVDQACPKYWGRVTKLRATLWRCRSQWARGLRRRASAERLLGSWVRIPLGAWMLVSCTMFVLSGRGLCDGPIPRPEESYRLWCVSECDQVKINSLDTCCEQVEEGRTTKRNETKLCGHADSWRYSCLYCSCAIYRS
jgi:hypothetical protein